MKVREVMTEDVVTVEREDSLQRAVGAMLQHGIGSVLVEDEVRPVGILTESDVLRAGYLAERALPDIRADREMGSPLITIAPDDDLETALETMRTHDVKKLPVEGGVEIVGIVTVTDVAMHHPEAIEAAAQIGDDGEDLG